MNLNVLDWWKQNNEMLGIIGKIAMDVLAIPSTIVAPESPFSTGRKVISELQSKMLSDLVVSRDWISFLTDGKWIFFILHVIIFEKLFIIFLFFLNFLLLISRLTMIPVWNLKKYRVEDC